MKRAHGQMSESLLLGALLAMAGGFFDAYTYLCRGKVFANAQTGNIVLFGANIAEGNWLRAAEYLLPILAFALGVVAAEIVKRRYKKAPERHQHSLETDCRAGRDRAAGRSGFYAADAEYHGQHYDLVHLRDAGRVVPQGARQRICNHDVYRQPAFGHRAACDSGHRPATGMRSAKRATITQSSCFFILGGAIGALTTARIGEKALLLTCIPLSLVFAVMFVEEEHTLEAEETAGKER